MSASNFGRPNFQNIFVIPKHIRNSISHEWISFFQKIHLQFDPCFLLQKLWETKLFPHWTLTIKFIWFCPAAYRSFVHFSSSSCFWTNARVHNKNRQLRLITCLHNPEAMSHENFRKYCHSWYCYLLSFHPRKFIFNSLAYFKLQFA